MKPKKQPLWPGYLAVPHELLHVIGYRLVGQPCQYRWGDDYVTLLGPMKLWQRLVGLLFPFGVFAGIFLVSGILSALSYREVLREGIIIPFILWTLIALMTGGYAGTAIGDLRRAYLLITGKPWYNWTPFDIFFWPVVDWAEVRKKLEASEKWHID